MTLKYMQLSDALVEKIRNGTYPIDSKLPTEAELSASYHVSRQTVRLALSQLVNKGLIHKKQGSGNTVISAGAKRGSRSIAIIATYADDYIYPVVLQDIQAVLARNHFTYQVFSTQNKVGLEREALQQILSLSFAGVLAEGSKTALPNPNLALYRSLKQNNIPLVFFHGGYPELEGAVCVTDDNYDGGYRLTRYLISKGHTCIGGIFKSDDTQGRERYQGYVSALRDTGLALPDDKLLWFSSEDRNAIFESRDLNLLRNFVQNRLSGCTALVAYNDEIAYQTILILHAAGYAIPGDIAVVSFDNSFYCHLSPVQLTSLSHAGEQTGTVAANKLLGLISGKEAASACLPWKLVERQSG